MALQPPAVNAGVTDAQGVDGRAPPAAAAASDDADEEAPFIMGLTKADIVQRMLASTSMRAYYVCLFLVLVALTVYEVLADWDLETWVWATEAGLIGLMCLEALLRSWLLGCHNCWFAWWHVLDCGLCLTCVAIFVADTAARHRLVPRGWYPVIMAPRFVALGVVIVRREMETAHIRAAESCVVLPPEGGSAAGSGQFLRTEGGPGKHRLSIASEIRAHSSCRTGPSAVPRADSGSLCSEQAYGSVGSLGVLAGFGCSASHRAVGDGTGALPIAVQPRRVPTDAASVTPRLYPQRPEAGDAGTPASGGLLGSAVRAEV
eukprot:TRINITY_DN9583_c0_g1_i1.p1 TRINITY_DN9583_c0_g1~~TRINITY_DN9583_c0_g1_i1.p1  ORF type:complete len:348 (+),score=75.68 TRINITY_DN9583_c0_g1_i1:93-1046(+)